jgi:putative ABC transport system permease protein
MGNPGLNPGDTVLIKEEPFTIVGIINETGSNDDYQLFIPLATAQRIFSKDGLISAVDIRALCNGCPVEIIADEINANIPGVRAVAIKQIANNEMNLISKMNSFLMTLAGITLLIGAFGVVNTMMSSVHERVKDIGIMKAVGGSRGQILRMFLYEAFIIGVVGGFAGYLAGTLLSYVMGPLIFDGVSITYILDYLPAALGIAIGVAVVASVYPAFRASQIKVADSIRSL